MIDEQKIQELWEEQKTYKFVQNFEGENFLIDTPPPTISGVLHIGHIFSYCHCDFVARFQRMRGKNVFYPIGFDANGLPTEKLIEKDQKIRLSELNHEQISDIFSQNITRYEQLFEDLFRQIGLSFDWSLRYNTFEPRVQKISQQSLLKLFLQNRLYRKQKPTFWDPAMQTAISQAELEEQEFTSNMNYIEFSFEDGQKINIATTRSELLPACVAVFFHPDDERYKKFQNQQIITPLGKKVPFLADENVKIEKGSGAVMCCTFGDEMDVKWQQIHSLPVQIILNRFGKIIENCISKFSDLSELKLDLQQKLQDLEVQLAGKKVEKAREIIVDFLQNENLLQKQEKIVHKVATAERSGAKVELLPTEQWYIKIIDYQQKFLQISEKLQFFPEKMRIKLTQWIENLRDDWCISRQRFYGISLPFWHTKIDEKAYLILPRAQDLPIDPRVEIPSFLQIIEKKDTGWLVQSQEDFVIFEEENFSAMEMDIENFDPVQLVQKLSENISYKIIKKGQQLEIYGEKSVLDTWATSALTPLIAYGEAKKFDLRHQSHEIIRSWAFFSIVRSFFENEALPWRQIMISGWCLSKSGDKMSKSKGNVIDPLKILQQFSVDNVRLWAASGKLGLDTFFSEKVLQQNKKLLNKLQNAAKFVQLHLQNFPEIKDILKTDHLNLQKNQICEIMDCWILHKFSNLLKKINSVFEKNDYCSTKELLERFFFDDFCNNYLEFIKNRAYNPENSFFIEQQKSAIYSLNFIFLQICKLFAPFIPFVSEEIWQNFEIDSKSIHSRAGWPIIEFIDEENLQHGEICVKILEEVRKQKTEKQFALNKSIQLLQVFQVDCDLQKVIHNLDLQSVTNSQKIVIIHNCPDEFAIKIDF